MHPLGQSANISLDTHISMFSDKMSRDTNFFIIHFTNKL